MRLAELKESLGIAPPPTPPLFVIPGVRVSMSEEKLFSFLSDSQYRSDEDSVVDQSFIQEFNSHFITEPLPPLVCHSPSSSSSSPSAVSSFVYPVSSSPPIVSDISISPVSSVGTTSSTQPQADNSSGIIYIYFTTCSFCTGYRA